MIIRGLTVSLLFAVLAAPAYAQDSTSEPTPEPIVQDNPQTRQTDEDENDFRRSQRRRDTGGIFDDIDINNRSTGGGGSIVGPEVKAIDRLDQESRRHLNKNRAKALAEAEPGEAIDAAYEPSEVAKTDDYVAKQEEAAWEEMIRDANNGIGVIQGPKGNGLGSGSGGGQGDDPNGQSGQGQAAQGQADGGQAGSGESGQGSRPSTSPLRGGSASSASSILDQLKGRSGSGGGNGQAPSGQSPSGQQQSEQGSGSSDVRGGSSSSASSILNQIKGGSAGSDQAQTQTQTQTAGSTQAPSNQTPSGQTAQSGQGESSAQGPAQAALEAANQAQSQAEADAAAEENAAAEAAAHRETISPLERLKRDPIERETTGGRTSASDFLNRGK